MAKITLANNRIEEFKHSAGSEITFDIVNHFIKRHQTERLPVFKENEDFILQQNIPIDKMFLEEESKGVFYGVRHKNNFANLIVNTHFSYFIGNGVSYTAGESDEDLEALKEYFVVREDNDLEQHDKDIAYDMGLYGVGYELVYMSENEIWVDRINPKETFVVYTYDLNPAPLFGVRYYEIENSKTIVELYTRNSYRKFEVTEASEVQSVLEVESKENIYGYVPIVEYRNNRIMNSDFQPVKTYIIDFDKTLTTQSNLIHYINDAILVFENVEAEIEDIIKMVRNKAINVTNTDGADSRISFLQKPLNVEGVKQHIDELKKSIFNQSSTPFLSSEELSKAPSGKALQAMYLNTDIIAKIKESNFAKGIKKRIEAIFSMLNFTKLETSSSFYSIKPIFSRNLPMIVGAEIEDLEKLARTVPLSKRTLLELVPNKYVDDVEKELDRQKTEQDEAEYSFEIEDSLV